MTSKIEHINPNTSTNLIDIVELTIFDNVKIGSNVRFGSGVILHDNVEIKDNVIIGDGVIVGKNTVIGDSTITFDKSKDNYLFETNTENIFGTSNLLYIKKPAGLKYFLINKMTFQTVGLRLPLILFKGISDYTFLVGEPTFLNRYFSKTIYNIAESYQDFYIKPTISMYTEPDPTNNINVNIQSGSIIGESSSISKNVNIGKNCVLSDNTIVEYNCLIGNGVVLKNPTVVGHSSIIKNNSVVFDILKPNNDIPPNSIIAISDLAKSDSLVKLPPTFSNALSGVFN